MNAFDSVIGYQQQHSRNPNVFQQMLEKQDLPRVIPSDKLVCSYDGPLCPSTCQIIYNIFGRLDSAGNQFYALRGTFQCGESYCPDYLWIFWASFLEGLSIGERTLLAFFPKFYSIKSLIDCNQCSAESTPRLCRTFVKLELELNEQKTNFSRLPPMINVRRMLAV